MILALKFLSHCDSLISPPPLDHHGSSCFPVTIQRGLEDVERRINVYVEDDELKPGYPQYQQLKEVTDQEKIYEVLYEEAYRETWATDMDELQTYLINFYNSYVESLPVITVPQPFLLGDRCSPRVQVVEREMITPEQFINQYGDSWKLKTFYVTRSMERYISKRRALHMRSVQEIMNVYNLSSADNYPRALRYAQEQFIGPRLNDSLTLQTVGDIIDSPSGRQRRSNDISNTGRQSRMRGNIY